MNAAATDTPSVRPGWRTASFAGALLCTLAFATPAAPSVPDAIWAPVAPPQVEPRMFACDSLRNQFLFQTDMGTIWGVTPGNPATWAVVDPNAPQGEPFFDPIRDRMVVIGRAAGTTLVATRLMSSASWDSVRIAGVPALVNTTRQPGAIVYDAPRNRVVMFGTVDISDGGFPPFTQYSNEVWVLDLGGTPHWTQLLPTGTPPTGRHDACVIFDPVRVQLVVFGGDDKGAQLPRDTWALSLSGAPAWQPIGQAGVLPPGRVLGGVLYDPEFDQMMIFCGSDRSGSSINDGFWVLPLAAPTQWTALPIDLQDVAGQRMPRMVFDPRQTNRVIAGVTNENGSSRSGTSAWTLTYYPQIPAWLVAKQYSWPDQPPLWAREYAAAAYDGLRDRLLVFGGSHINNGTTGVKDGWAETLTSGAWTPFDMIPPSGVPPVTNQLYGNMVFDRARDRMVVFGTPPGFQVQAWTEDISNAPSGQVPISAGGILPMGRDYPSFVYDPHQDRVLMFGGLNAGGYSNELWQLTLGAGPTWTLLTTAGTPPAGRDHATAVYDSIGNRLVVHGGIVNGGLATTDTWVCDLAGTPTWQALSPSGTPPGPVFGNETNVSGVYDAVRQRMVVTAPESLGTRQGAWALSLDASPAWTHLTAAGPPPSARAAVATAYDARRDALVMFGGRSVGLRWPDLNDTWFLDFAPPVVPAVTCPASFAWVAGSPSPFLVHVDPVLDQTADYRLTSQRAWPGYPITGSIDLHAGTGVDIPFLAPVPDTAAIGLNALVFQITPRGAAATAVCSFHMHDATTPTAGIFVSALATPDQVRLHWQAPDVAGSCTLERRTGSADWHTLASVARGVGGDYSYVDTDVIAGARYGYRVRTSPTAAPSVETWVDVPGTARLALAGLQPNPAGGPVTVAFTLPDAQPARLQLVDVAGRRVIDRSLSGLGAGAHVLRIDDGRTLPAGVYFVRLIHGRDVVTTRGAIVR